MVTKVNVHKAQRMTSDSTPVDDVVIEIGGELGECGDRRTLDEASYEFQREAHAVAGALRASLPGGMLDYLTSVLLEYKIGQLRVLSAPQPDRSPEALNRQNEAMLKLLEGRVTDAHGQAAIRVLRSSIQMPTPVKP